MLLGLAGSALSFAMHQPAVKQALADVDYVLGINESSRARYNFYRENYAATLLPRGVTKTPIRMSFDQLLRGFNQANWSALESDPVEAQRIWENLRIQTRMQGIDVHQSPIPGPLELQGIEGEVESSQWRRLVDFSAAGAPLESAIKAYYRSATLGPELSRAASVNLNYSLRRSMLRRKEDRELILSPFADFNPADVQRLYWLGLIDQEEWTAFMRAAGIVRGRDQEYMLALALRMPTPEQLQGWTVRKLWNEDYANRYELDAGFGDDPVAAFFSAKQGSGRPTAVLPGEPNGEKSWLKLARRASRPLPDYSLSRELQYRLRPNGVGLGESVVPGVPEWTADNTRDMLRITGFTEPIVNRLMGLVYQPLNIRLINHVLSPYATHPAVKQIADEQLGHPTDWIEGAMLDHGFAPALAKVAAAGILAQADDRANAERLEHEKRQRQESRDQAQKEYASGALTFEQTVPLMTDEFFPANMAAAELLMIDRRQELAVVEVKIKALQSEFVSGKISASDATAYLATFLARPERIGQLLTEWTWERTEKTRMLETGGILSALKTGLMPPATALQRMLNLGWTQADALIELAQVEQSLAAAQAKTQQAAATHQMAQANKLAAEHAKDAKAALVQAAKESRERVQTQKAIDRASHEKLLAQSEYYARIHASNDAFAKADAKGNDQKKDAEIEKQLGAYQRYLLDQLKIIQQGPEVAHEVLPLDARQIPLPEPAAANSGAHTPNPEPATPIGGRGGEPGASGGLEGSA